MYGDRSLELDARQLALFEAHLHLASFSRHLRLRWARAWRDEVLQAAHIGLCMAARDYDPALGVPFEAYATTRINWIVHRALFPRNRGGAETARRQPRHGDTLSGTDIFEATRREVSWEEPVGEKFTKGDMAEALLAQSEAGSAPGRDARARALFELREAIGRARLSEREREVLRLRFAEGLTMAEASSRMGYRHPRTANTLTVSAVAKLREYFRRRRGPPRPLAEVLVRRRVEGGNPLRREAHAGDRAEREGD